MEALWSGVENARGKCLCSLSGNWDPGLIGAVYPNIYMRYALSSHQVKMCCDSFHFFTWLIDDSISHISLMFIASWV